MKATVGSKKWHKRHKRKMHKRRGASWCLVYGLYDPRDEAKAIRYVGQTRNSKVRLAYHLKNARDGKAGRVLAWIRELLDAGVAPVLAVLDGDGAWDVSEIIWIERLRVGEADLLNVLRGGCDQTQRRGRIERHPDAIALNEEFRAVIGP